MEGYLEYPSATHHIGEKLTVIARCGSCPWSAEHTDDDVVHLSTFLRNQLILHIHDAHPEEFPAFKVVHLVPEKES